MYCCATSAQTPQPAEASDTATTEAANAGKGVETAKKAITDAAKDAAKKTAAEKQLADAEKAVKTVADKKTAADKAAAEAKTKVETLAVGLSTVVGGFKGSVWAVAFSPNGQVLATGSHDDGIRLWDVGTLKPLFAGP